MSYIPDITDFDDGQAVDHGIECQPPAAPDAGAAIGLYSARRFAERLHRTFDRNDGLDGGWGPWVQPHIRIRLNDLERLITYRRAMGSFDVVKPGQYVRCAVGALVLKAARYGDDPGELVRAWAVEFVPEYGGTPDLSTPVLRVDTIAEALQIREDEVRANVLNSLVSIDRPPDVRASDDREYDRAYSENRRRGAGAKPQSSRTLTRDTKRVAAALKIGVKKARDLIRTSVIDLAAEIAKLDAAAACQNSSVTGTDIGGLLFPTEICSPEAPPPTIGLNIGSSAEPSTTAEPAEHEEEASASTNSLDIASSTATATTVETDRGENGIDVSASLVNVATAETHASFAVIETEMAGDSPDQGARLPANDNGNDICADLAVPVPPSIVPFYLMAANDPDDDAADTRVMPIRAHDREAEIYARLVANAPAAILAFGELGGWPD
ncbi:hypothetical protein [Methylobacterium nonmethylotrophicum]|uniref:Uncharacterized protein n=1 Tax=Methylobacterium nonmethylotrophicum TaxID=1141884 RepID=A0A4Z0NWV9_9HYPH|nr:hypothetical protein [Methylobacterium nonmethylotrophicum]TGE01968.1 hypothetical protein EU555_04700 [Methylobacterium nonmethylotrophicum]